MTTKKKGSKAKSKNTAKKQILTPVEPVKQAKQSKLARMVELLQSPEGIPLKELADKLSWLENSVRGTMSLYVKKHPEYTLVKEKVQGVRTYRLIKNGD